MPVVVVALRPGEPRASELAVEVHVLDEELALPGRQAAVSAAQHGEVLAAGRGGRERGGVPEGADGWHGRRAAAG